MKIAFLRPRFASEATIAVVASALVLTAVPGLAAAATPLVEAGWHGRAVMKPVRTGHIPIDSHAAARPAPVAQLQRMLWRIGYRPGPVDGIYGPRTQASVQWFQIKHGLRADGIVGPQTLGLLHVRAHARDLDAAANAVKAPAAKAPASSSPATQSVGPPAEPGVVPIVSRPAAHAAPRAGGGHGGPGTLLLALAGGLALAAISLVSAIPVRSRRRRRGPEPVAKPEPAAAKPKPATAKPASAKPATAKPATAKPAPAVVAAPDRAKRIAHAVGYVAGGDRAEVDRHTVAIRRACAERDWHLARLVRDGHRQRGTQRRPGVGYALAQLSEVQAKCLVVGRLEHVGHTPGELAAALRWCAGHDVDLVALDVGLDTGTRDGRLAARCLLALGNGVGPSNGAARRNGDHAAAAPARTPHTGPAGPNRGP